MAEKLIKEVLHTYHINGIDSDGRACNLIRCKDEQEYKNIYQNLMEKIFTLLDYGIVKFDAAHSKYYIDLQTLQQNFPTSYGFEDIAILQGKNKCKSRLDANIESYVFRDVKRPIPLLASNMSSVVDSSFCIELFKLGALGIMHRALPDEMLEEEVKKIAAACDIVCASIGIGEGQFELCRKLIECGANVIFIDVAHGYSDIVIELGRKIKKEFSGVKVVIGNAINTDIMYEICDFADALKVGIANGFVCETKNTAACNEKQFTSVFKFKELSKEFGIPIISDGGIREPADFTKAIAAGANSVMAGSIFARCPESAAESIEIDGKVKRAYAGMSSRSVQNKWKNGIKEGICPEGKIRYLDVGEPVKDLLNRYAGALRSGITYSGADNIIEFQNIVKFTRV